MTAPLSTPQAATFTVYRIKDPGNEAVLYVGQTADMDARRRAHLRDRRDTPKACYLRAMLANGRPPVFEVMHEVQTREHAERLEMMEIARHVVAGAPLFNRMTLQLARQIVAADLWQQPYRRTR